MQLLSSHLSWGRCAHHRLPMQTRLSFFTVLARRSASEFKFGEVTAVPPPERCRSIGKLLLAGDAICSAATLRKSTGGIISTPCSPNPLSTASNPHQCAHSLLPLRKTKTKTKNTSWIYHVHKAMKNFAICAPAIRIFELCVTLSDFITK